jgi:hypothetical protein
MRSLVAALGHLSRTHSTSAAHPISEGLLALEGIEPDDPLQVVHASSVRPQWMSASAKREPARIGALGRLCNQRNIRQASDGCRANGIEFTSSPRRPALRECGWLLILPGERSCGHGSIQGETVNRSAAIACWKNDKLRCWNLRPTGRLHFVQIWTKSICNRGIV